MGQAMDYNGFAKTYSETRSAVPWVTDFLVKEFSKLNSPAVIIEIGCGTANYSIEMLKVLSNNTYKGFDLSEDMLYFAKKRTDKIEFVRANADDRFPYHDKDADAAFLVDVIHHITNYVVFFNECSRILKPGGILIIVTDLEENMRKRSGIKYFPEKFEVEMNRYPTEKELIKHAINSGFSFVSSELAEGTNEIDDDMISKIERKHSSSSRLISEEAFQRGLERVREAKVRGEKWFSSYTILKYQKIIN